MEVNPLTVVSVVGVASLLIERVFYYKSRYKKKETIPPNPGRPENPSHGERLMGLETDVENLKENNDKDHGLIRDDIRKLTNILNRKVFSMLNGLVRK